VNLDVAYRAGLKKSFLAVERRRSASRASFGVGQRVGVALQAQQINVADAQHVGIGATVREMARLAAFDLHRRMLENERSLLINVAGEADGVLRGRGADLLWSHGAVRIVAIRTLH